MQKALITGASGGIGKELALIMAEAGHDLILVARKESELQIVKKQIASLSTVDVITHTIDLSRPGAAKKLYTEMKDQSVEMLVNNAGAGLTGDFFNDNPERTVEIAQLNMISVMELSQLFGKDFIKKDSGRILNIASIAAFFPGPKQPVYYATKAFVRNLSRALAYNVRGTNVTVTLLNPGVTQTNFFRAANNTRITGGATAKSVAELGYKAMMSGKVEVTHGIRNKLLTNVFSRLIPYRYQAYLVDRASDA